MTIGEVAELLGIEAHGYRRYDAAAVERARTVHKLRKVGLSLPEVIAAMAPTKAQAQAVVTVKIETLEAEVRARRAAITFLQHTVDCRHRYLDECPECATFVRES